MVCHCVHYSSVFRMVHNCVHYPKLSALLCPLSIEFWTVRCWPSEISRILKKVWLVFVCVFTFLFTRQQHQFLFKYQSTASQFRTSWIAWGIVWICLCDRKLRCKLRFWNTNKIVFLCFNLEQYSLLLFFVDKVCIVLPFLP